MKRPIFINLTVDRFSEGCGHAQTDLDVPIGALCTVCVPFEPLSVRARRTRCVYSLVRGCNPRQGVFHDYSHVFVL